MSANPYPHYIELLDPIQGVIVTVRYICSIFFMSFWSMYCLLVLFILYLISKIYSRRKHPAADMGQVHCMASTVR
jgi:hypothetical protein